MTGQVANSSGNWISDGKGRVRLKRVWEFVPKAEKKRNERVKVSSVS